MQGSFKDCFFYLSDINLFVILCYLECRQFSLVCLQKPELDLGIGSVHLLKKYLFVNDEFYTFDSFRPQFNLEIKI